MPIDPETVYAIIQDTWTATLGFPVERLNREEPTALGEFSVCVKIAGAWDGEIRLHCSSELARLVATSIFQADADKIGSGEIQDALSELVHIVGGNLKPLLPHPVTLSLPALSEPSDWTQTTPQWQMVCRLSLTSEGHPFTVTLLGDYSAVPKDDPPVQRLSCP
jgi:CheY-specific phosphatase CheX